MISIAYSVSVLFLGIGSLIAPERTSAEVYHDLQARLARYASVRVSTTPVVGSFSSGEGEYGFLRPDKGFRHEPNIVFVTDGRTMWDSQLGKRPRSVQSDELARYAGLRGFESFFAPGAKVVGPLPPRSVERYDRRLLALDLRIDGESGVLYLDEATRLPFGWAWAFSSPKEERPQYLLLKVYSKVLLGAPIHSAELKPPAGQGDLGEP